MPKKNCFHYKQSVCKMMMMMRHDPILGFWEPEWGFSRFIFSLWKFPFEHCICRRRRKKLYWRTRILLQCLRVRQLKLTFKKNPHILPKMFSSLTPTRYINILLPPPSILCVCVYVYYVCVCFCVIWFVAKLHVSIRVPSEWK